MSLSERLRPVSFAELPFWRDDDSREAFAAFRRSALQAELRPYRSGSLGIAFPAFAEAYAEARANPDPADSKGFFERHFVPCCVMPESGAMGLVTSFYEPVAEASPIRTGRFLYPLYRRPADLIDLDESNRPAGLDASYAFGRAGADGVTPYFDRAAIESGALEGRSLELAWLADPLELFLIHVQGAARLVFPDGARLRVTYAAKSGHPFTGPGRVLVDMGELDQATVTLPAIRRWFAENPGRLREILQRNRSFIFFREAPVANDSLGPVAAAKVPLTPRRSLAVDRLLHTFGTPFFIDAPTLTAFDGKPFRRLMIAQDTGTAIVGAARGDLFAGSGDAAGEIAGIVRHPADFYALVPRALVAS